MSSFYVQEVCVKVYSKLKACISAALKCVNTRDGADVLTTSVLLFPYVWQLQWFHLSVKETNTLVAILSSLDSQAQVYIRINDA